MYGNPACREVDVLMSRVIAIPGGKSKAREGWDGGGEWRTWAEGR